MLNIGLLAYPHCMPAGLFAGLDIFQAANTIAEKNIFNAKIVSLSAKVVSCAHGQKVTPDSTAANFNFDVLIVPGFWGYSTETVATIQNQNQEIQKYLTSISSKKILASYCTGCILHAGTHRLRKKSATASWWLAQQLKYGFPDVRWQVNKIISGDNQDMTASGANGFYPLLYNLVEQHAGKKVLAEVQKYLMTPVQIRANDPFYELEILLAKERVLKLRRYIEKSPARDITLAKVSEYLHVSSKTLSRQMQKDIPWTPSKFFRLIKYKQAGNLLTTTDDSVAEICDRLGFDDEVHFRKSFKQITTMTPTEYRAKYSG